MANFPAKRLVSSESDNNNRHFIVRLLQIFIAPMMEAASTPEMSVNSYQTTQNTENSHLHTRRCENLKSHQVFLL
jgi:hypothetical protein